jgi:hypothetical protein
MRLGTRLRIYLSGLLDVSLQPAQRLHHGGVAAACRNGQRRESAAALLETRRSDLAR